MEKLIDDSAEKQRKNGSLKIKLMPINNDLWKREFDKQTCNHLDRELANAMCKFHVCIWYWTVHNATFYIQTAITTHQ